MSKINYPESDGLRSIVKDPINQTIKQLNSAINSCSFLIPVDFKYKNYLVNLSTVISDYATRSSEIYSTACATDNMFKSTFESMSSFDESLDITVIEERDRLVK